eukprot:1678741-Prymnesium_polylepis.1
MASQLTASIRNAVPSPEGSHTEYIIHVAQSGAELCTTRRRFSAFLDLHKTLMPTLRLPPFPAKKRLFNGSTRVLEERIVLLQQFVDDVLAASYNNPGALIYIQPILHEFLAVPAVSISPQRPTSTPARGAPAEAPLAVEPERAAPTA